MTSDIEVQDAATVMANEEEAVEHVERERRDREEIHRRDGFAVFAKKRQPAFSGFWAPWPLFFGSSARAIRFLSSRNGCRQGIFQPNFLQKT
jgi:hypothetical protein